MYIISNAIKNIFRNKGRNILISIIAFAVISSISVSIIINNTTEKIIDDYKGRFGVKVKIEYDTSSLLDGSAASEPTTEQILDFGDSDLLKKSEFIASTYLYSDNIKAIDEDIKGEGYSKPLYSEEEYREPTLKLLAYSDVNQLAEFGEGYRKIKEGSFFENENECIISEELAKLNNLKVGDYLDVTYAQNNNYVSRLKVSGIYEDNTQEYTMGLKSAMVNRRNEVLVNMDSLIKSVPTNTYKISQYTYYLNNPENLDLFKDEVKNKGLGQGWLVKTDENTYKKIVGPVEGLKESITTFLIIILSLGGAVLVALSIFAIRERKYEIGVLRAMGMSKVNVAKTVVIENIIIIFICLGLGLVVGKYSSQPITDNMLQNQIKIAEEAQYESFWQSTGNNSGTLEATALDKIEVGLTIDSVIKISVMSMILIILSSASAIIMITRYEPMKILRERE